MKKFLLLLMTGTALYAQQTVQLSFSPGYEQDVFFNFSNGESQQFVRDNWDIAFYRVSAQEKGVRLNEGKGLNVYQVSDDLNDWETIDLSTLSSESVLHNSDTEWAVGAFDNGSASFGWGEYNMTNHHVQGSVIFVIENPHNDTYYKFLIEDYFGGYTVKYSVWDGAAWSSDFTMFIDNAAAEGKFFNYLNLENGTLIDASPTSDNWDLKFTKYSTLVTTNDGNQIPYVVTGVLQNPNVTVAAVEEEFTSDFANIDDLDFSDDINSIGYDWKALNDSWVYDIVDDKVYYVKADNTIYRMYFSSFDGITTGDFSFVYEEDDLAVLDANGNTKFSVYPNPVKNNKVHIVYENSLRSSEAIEVRIYNLAGQEVYKTSLQNQTGLYQKDLNLGSLAKGIYIITIESGMDKKSEKLIID